MAPTADRPVSQAAIREAARRLFARKGFHATKVEEIAQAAGVAKGTVYLYYETKLDILRDLMTAEIGSLCRSLEALRARPPREALEEAYRLLAERALRYSEEGSPLLLREIYGLPEEFQAQVRALKEPLLEILEEIVERAKPKHGSPRFLAFLILSIVGAVVHQEWVPLPGEPEEVVKEGWRALSYFFS